MKKLLILFCLFSCESQSQNLKWLANRHESTTSPQYIPGLVLRFRTDHGVVTSGSNVTSWTDEQMGFVLSQGTGALQPQFVTNSLNGHASIKFTSQYLVGANQITALEGVTGITIYMLTSGSPVGAYAGVPCGAFGYQLHNDLAAHAITFLGNNGSADQLYTFFNNGSNAPVSVKSLGDNWSFKSLVYDGSQSSGSRQKFYNNGSLKLTTSGPATTFTQGTSPEVIVGGYSLSAGYTSFDGSIVEILVYNRALNSTEQGYLNDYFFSTYMPSKRVICDGNSLTLGTGGTSNNNYPNYLQTSLGSSWVVYNIGVTSQTTPNMTADAATQIDNEYNSTRFSKEILIAWECTNDSYFGANAATVYSDYVTYCQARRAAGFKVIACTYLSRSNGGTPGTFNADRATVNANIVANWATFADGLADLAADSRIGVNGAETNTTYFAADLVHLNNTGYGIVRDIILPIVNSL